MDENRARGMMRLTKERDPHVMGRPSLASEAVDISARTGTGAGLYVAAPSDGTENVGTR
jgi:hypothetical protein